MIEVILYSILTGVIGTGLGGLFGAYIPTKSRKALGRILGVSSGVTLSLIFFDLLPEAIELGGTWWTIAALAFGVLFVVVLERFGDHDAQGEEVEHSHLKRTGLIMVLAITLHNIPAGIAIGSGFTHSHETGIVLVILLLLHNLPEGFGISLIFALSGMKKVKAAMVAVLLGVPLVLGAMGGYLIGELSPLFNALILGIAAGSLLFANFSEIIPTATAYNGGKHPSLAIIGGIALGLILMTVIH